MSDDELTFRDFAGAVMGNDWERAAEVLVVLLGVERSVARRAAAHFQVEMDNGGPTFMMKAMGMRQVVAARDNTQLVALLGECFGLTGAAADSAATAVMARYPEASVTAT